MAAWGPPQTYGIGNDTVAWNPLSGPPPMMQSRYSMNAEVMVNSQSQGGWVPAKVIEVYPDGTVTVEYLGSGFTKKIPLEHQDTQLKPANAPPMPMSGQATVQAAPNFPNAGRDVSGEWGGPPPGYGGGASNGPPAGNYGLPGGGPNYGGPSGGPPSYGGPPNGPPAYGGSAGGPPAYGGPSGGPPAYGGPPPNYDYGGPSGGPPPAYGGPSGGPPPAYGAPPPANNAPSGFSGAGGFGAAPQMGPGPSGPGWSSSAPGPGYNYEYSGQQGQSAPAVGGGFSSSAPYSGTGASPAFANPVATPSTALAQPSTAQYSAQVSSVSAAPAATATYEAGHQTALKSAAELGASPGAIVVRAPKAPKIYTVGMEVMTLSDSSGGWVSGTVLGVDADGTITVQYGQNTKAIPKEHQATHLSPKKGAQSMPSAAASYPTTAAAPMPTMAMPTSAGGMPAFAAAAPIIEQAPFPNYAAAPAMPEQAGTVRYDLAQIAAMNDQVEQQGYSAFPPAGGGQPNYNPAPPFPGAAQAAW